MVESGVCDKNGAVIKAGDILKDDWQGFLYKVKYEKAAFVLVPTGFRIDPDGNKVKSWIPKGMSSLIYDNYRGFSGRHEIW